MSSERTILDFLKDISGSISDIRSFIHGRYLTVIFELKSKGLARPITGWDMSRAELRNYKKHRK